MERKLNVVKIEKNYHHGDLRQALIQSALALLADKGVEAFSLRETARRAGVSPAAPKHHFKDTRGLLTALATIAFTRLADALEESDAAAAQDLSSRLGAQGAAYAAFALAEPALFALMWRTAMFDLTDINLLAEKARAFDSIDRLVRGAAAPRVPHADPAMAPTIACWSLVHGFVCLMLDGGLGEDRDAQAQATDTLLPAMIGLLNIRN
ncbi:MAG: TetR/AcrR family transcriptional regulator [Thalassobaculaceae bacterium]|nr:TetR/AcrR family transcriptional regulator [Thalassobaculaceae bacterium]